MPKWQELKAKLRQGWCKDALVDIHGNVCLVGGIEHVENISFHSVNAYTEVLAPIIRANYPDRCGTYYVAHDAWGTVVDFNNHPDTVLDDIIAVIEKAEADVLR